MIPDFTWRQGDVQPTFAQTLTYSDGTPVNLEGATLALILRSLASAQPLALTSTPEAFTPAGQTVPCQIQWSPDPADTAVIEPGPYLANWQVVFTDGTQMTFPTDGYLWIEVEESLTTSGGLTVGVRPAVKDVAGLLRARTKQAGTGGKELGTFVDGQTRPGASEVDGLIDDALDEVLGKVVGIDTSQPPGTAYNAPGSAYERRIRGAVRLYAAILIEASYWPEQVQAGRSVASTYQTLYDSRIKALIAEDKMGGPEGLGDAGGKAGGADSPADAAWAFPRDTGGLVGWASRW